MHVIVVGCGRVGAGLVREASRRGHTVAIIDRQQRAFRKLPDGFRGRRIQGIGFDRARLEEAGIREADAVAAVTSGDNTNIVVARIARERYGVGSVVARIYDPRRAAIYERLGISTVATVRWSTDRVLRRLLDEPDGVAWTDPSTRVALVERTLPTSWAGHDPSRLELDGTARLVSISRLGEGVLPGTGLVLQEGDVAWLAVRREAMESLERHLAGGPAAAGDTP